VKASLFTDGGARGNPGPAAYGFVLESEDGTVLAAESEEIGIATNNVAEYRGLIAGLQRALELQVPEVEVVSDSELMVKQMRGEYRVRKDSLRPLHDEAASLARRVGRVEYRHVKRAQNELADRLVNEALDGTSSTSTVTHPFGRAVEAGDEDAALATFADDVEFRSPAVFRPYHGKEEVGRLLRVVATVFENFRYTNEWRDGSTTILFFEASVGDRELQGVDILEENATGLVEKLTVLVRPLSGLQALAATMAARLGASEP
jgi:ribonuclease HI